MAGKVNLSLHTKQMEVYRSQTRYRVVVAGRRWGKTALSRVLIIKKAQKTPAPDLETARKRQKEVEHG